MIKILLSKDSRYPLATKTIRSLAQRIAKKYVGERGGRIILSIKIVGRRKAKQLNQTWRGKNYIPTVLTFPLSEKTPTGWVYLGEVVLCFSQIKKEALWRNRKIEEILGEYLNHGIANLVPREGVEPSRPKTATGF